MKVKLGYMIIFTIDLFKGSVETVANSKPQSLRSAGMKITEDKVEDRKVYKSHRKYCGMMDRDRLVSLLHEMEDVSASGSLDVSHTMGSLTDMGFMSAVSVDASLSGGNMNMYVSQIPMDEKSVWRMISSHPQKEDVLFEFQNRMESAFEGLYDQLSGNWDELPDSFDFDFDNIRFEFKEEKVS